MGDCRFDRCIYHDFRNREHRILGMGFEWNILGQEADDITQTLLANRGITPEESYVFLNPDWDRDTHDPSEFTQMPAAVDRVFRALEEGEKIMIHGDYDADGISGSTLLYTALRDICEALDYRVEHISVFLPDRERDGYGIAMHNIEAFGEEGVNLIITVDCGISNDESLGRAHELGMDVVICDHHQLGERLPEYAIIIHPLAPGESYPNKSLCGTGVAFKLASGLIREAAKRGATFPDGYEKWLLDLVAIATVTDVMPLKGENRVLEKFGLLVLNKTRREGIRKILDFSRGEIGSVDTQTIGFQIGPRINAAGRVASPKIAFQALSARDPDEAREFASELERLNRERQKISNSVFQHAVKIAREKKNKFVNVIWHDDWLHGVVGLVAGKLVSEFGTPAFVFTKVGDHYVGSGRSIGGLHLVEAMRSCGDIFIKAGGHPQACGLSISNEETIKLFEERVTAFTESFFNGQAREKTLDIDAELSLSQIDWDFYQMLQKFEPFGEGNPRPLFMSRGLQVISAEAIGSEGKHLRLTVNPEDSKIWKLIGFRFGDWAKQLRMGDLVDIVYEIGVNEWNGRRELQLKIEDLKRSDGVME